MHIANLALKEGHVIWACQLNNQENIAFLEFRTVEETTKALALDGIILRGVSLRIQYPLVAQTGPPNQKS